MNTMSTTSTALPNLSNLSLHCKSCAPMGEVFDEFEDAQGSVPAIAEKRDDWSPDKWGGAASPDCPICLEPLHRRARGDRNASKEVEALFEIPECSHCFHRECLEAHIEGALRGGDDEDRSLRCPTCKRPIAQAVLDTVFDESAGMEEVDDDDGFAAEGERQRAGDERPPTPIGYEAYPIVIRELIRDHSRIVTINPIEDPHTPQVWQMLESAWQLQYSGETQIDDLRTIEIAEGIKVHYDQIPDGFWKLYMEIAVKMTASGWGDGDQIASWLQIFGFD